MPARWLPRKGHPVCPRGRSPRLSSGPGAGGVSFCAAELFAGPCREAGAGAGAGRGRAALGGTAAARSPSAAALPPVSPSPAASASDFPVWLPRSGGNRHGHGENVRVRVGERVFKAKKPANIRKLAIGFGRSSGSSGGYFRRRCRQIFRVSRGRRFPGRQTRRGTGFCGEEILPRPWEPRRAPPAPGRPGSAGRGGGMDGGRERWRNGGRDGWRDERGQRAGETRLSLHLQGKAGTWPFAPLKPLFPVLQPA